MSGPERTRIAEAVGLAEAATSAEIVVFVAARAGLYRSVSPILALAGALALPWPLILLTPWSAGTIAVAQAGFVLALVLATLNPRVRLALVPRAIRRSRAHDAALREFAARGIGRTRERTGVLIYLAVAEGHAEIVADHGIAVRVPKTAWARAIETLLDGLRRGAAAEGLVAAVEQVGALLGAEFPIKPGDIDELPNRVIVVSGDP